MWHSVFANSTSRSWSEVLSAARSFLHFNNMFGLKQKKSLPTLGTHRYIWDMFLP
jgi:hypothetical protein